MEPALPILVVEGLDVTRGRVPPCRMRSRTSNLVALRCRELDLAAAIAERLASGNSMRATVRIRVGDRRESLLHVRSLSGT